MREKTHQPNHIITSLSDYFTFPLESITDNIAKFFPDVINQDILDLQATYLEMEQQNKKLRLVQEKLIKDRDHYLDLYNSAPIGLFCINSEGLLLEANLTIAKILGVAGKLLIGHKFVEFIEDEDLDIFSRYLRDLLKSQGSRLCEIRLLNNSGGYRWIKLECSTCRDNENPDRFQMALTLIDDYKRLEQKVHERAKRDRAIVADQRNYLTRG